MSESYHFSVGLPDEHLRAIGFVCVAWNYLEQEVTQYLATMIPVQTLKDIHVMGAELDIRDKLALLRGFAFNRINDHEMRDELDDIINHIDNELRSDRNRIIHDSWVQGAGPTKRLRYKTAYKKPESRQPLRLTTFEEVEMSVEDIQEVGNRIGKAMGRLTINRGLFIQKYDPQPIVIDEPYPY